MSLRPYDKKSNKRFDQTHPLFPKTKSGPNKGKPSKTLTKRHIEALGDKVDLVPNLTHLTGVLDSFDAFGGGSRWGAHVAKGVLIDYSRTGKKACENVQEVSRLVNDQMSEAADNGSIIHDDIEHLLIRAINGAEETEHPVLFKHLIRRNLSAEKVVEEKRLGSNLLRFPGSLSRLKQQLPRHYSPMGAGRLDFPGIVWYNKHGIGGLDERAAHQFRSVP